MRDFIKTWIVTGIVLLCMLVAFFVASNLEQGIEMLTRTQLPLTDPDVKLNYDKIANNKNIL